MTKWKDCRKKPVVVQYREVAGSKETIVTREGTLYAIRGRDYVIKGVKGEVYPIKKEIFEETYERM